MQWDQYVAAASRTANRSAESTTRDRRINFALGLVGEAGEVANLVKKTEFHGHPLGRPALVDELGDVLWYLAMLADEHGISFDELASHNISKLRTRYPSGFSEEASRQRVDAQEAARLTGEETTP
jgi:NTP pyrophosphatase (non-canonical NTP hydrolase)